MATKTGDTTTIAGAAGGTVRVTIFDNTAPGGGVKVFGVSNRSTSAGPVYVIVGGLHNEAMPIGPGVSWPFRKDGNINNVQIYGDGSNAATVDWGVLIR
jgi:hypothetical protein